MYMDDVKLFAKNQKELETLIPVGRIYTQDIGRWHRKMYHDRNEKRQTTPNGRNGTNKSRKFREKETYKYFGILETDTILQMEMKEKKIKKKNQKATGDKNILQKPYQSNNYLGCSPHTILGTILEVDQRRT